MRGDPRVDLSIHPRLQHCARRCALFALANLAGLLPGPGDGLQAQTATFEGRVEVGEREVLIRPPARRTARPDADDFQVLIDGVPREVVSVEPLADGEATVWIWFDLPRLDGEEAASAALALAQEAERITRLGPTTLLLATGERGETTAVPAVEVIAADATPRRLQAELADLTGRFRRGELAALRPGQPPPSRELWRRLVDRAAAEPLSGPRFLLLVSEGFHPTPEEMAAFGAEGACDPAGGAAGLPQDADPRSGAGPPPTGPSKSARDSAASAPGSATSATNPEAATAVCHAARELSAAGWTVVPVLLASSNLEREKMPPATVYGPDGESGPLLDLFGVAGWLRKKARGEQTHRAAADPREYESAFLPELAPLQALATATGGRLVHYRDTLPAALDELRDRWRLAYRARPEDASGAVRRLEVRWLRDGRQVTAREWVGPASR